MQSFGKVSVIMPAFNDGPYIGEAIESVLRQTYCDFELLVVDDKSSDDTLAVVEQFCDSRIRVYRKEKNTGAAESRNIALAASTGIWIAFLDGDDLWAPDKLEKQLSFMTYNKYDFSYTAYEEFATGSSPDHLVRGPKCINKRKMFSCDYIGCLTVVYRKAVLPNLSVPVVLKKRNDYAMWISISKKADCFFLDEPLARYRVRKNTVSHTSKIKLFKSHFQLFVVQEGFCKIKAFLFALQNALLTVLYKKLKYRRPL